MTHERWTKSVKSEIDNQTLKIAILASYFQFKVQSFKSTVYRLLNGSRFTVYFTVSGSPFASRFMMCFMLQFPSRFTTYFIIHGSQFRSRYTIHRSSFTFYFTVYSLLNGTQSTMWSTVYLNCWKKLRIAKQT